MRALIAIFGIFSLTACTYVQVSDAGDEVALASAEEVNSCTAIGNVTSRTRAKVVLERGSAKVQQELIDLARNEAAQMGANTIVPLGEPTEGKQSFRAYRCE